MADDDDAASAAGAEVAFVVVADIGMNVLITGVLLLPCCC